MNKHKALLILTIACGLLAWTTQPTPQRAASGSRSAPILVPRVVRVLPHDTLAMTQGLLLHGGHFYESTGGRGVSTLRQVEVETGRVVRSVALDSALFGEGLAIVNDTLVQLTWQTGRAFLHSPVDLSLIRSANYTGEGWGLCFDGASLWMTNGSTKLYRRDPRTFAPLDSVTIMLDGRPLRSVNELECVGPHVFGNVYMRDTIVKIAKTTGVVEAVVDGSQLLAEDKRPRNAENSLNGIAHDPATGRMYLTGKHWPYVFEVVLVPAAQARQ